MVVCRDQHEKVEDYISLLFRKDEHEFFRFMRVTKDTFKSLVKILEEGEHFNPERPHSTGPRPTAANTALAVTLWYLGNMCSQRDVAERFHISQGHACYLINVVVDALCDQGPSVIVWPSFSDINAIEAEFKEFANFPGIVGAIDGCHVQAIVPDDVQSDYLDRNHNHSVNLMAVCDAQKKFTYCFAGYPGSIHDQRVFANSTLGQSLTETSNIHFPSKYYHIVGDSAFMLHTHVMVPYKDNGALTVSQMNFNKRLSQSRRVIENAFGLLKGRFRRLRRLECALEHVSKTITACCVLHNVTIGNAFEIDLLMSDDADETACASESETNRVSVHATAAATLKRDTIAQNLLQ